MMVVEKQQQKTKTNNQTNPRPSKAQNPPSLPAPRSSLSPHRQTITPMKRHAYTHLTLQEYQQLDQHIQHQGFPNRTAYFTAVARVTLYGWHTDYHTPESRLDPETLAWITWHKHRMTQEDQLRQQFFDIITDLAFPVIAARGSQTAWDLLQNELQNQLAQQTGTLPSYQQLKTWIQTYETIHAEALGRHRADLIRENARQTEQHQNHLTGTDHD